MKFKIQNPIDDGWYADPEARIYEGKYCIYATRSLPFDEQKNQVCFTSDDLTHWQRHEDIIDMSGFPWATRAIWAPTIIDKNGKYYYVFASNDKLNNIVSLENKNIKLDTINLNLYESLASTISAFKSGDIDVFTTANKNSPDATASGEFLYPNVY